MIERGKEEEEETHNGKKTFYEITQKWKDKKTEVRKIERHREGQKERWRELKRKITFSLIFSPTIPSTSQGGCAINIFTDLIVKSQSVPVSSSLYLEESTL